MSRFDCRCGYEIRDITYPTTHEGRLLTDLEMDDHLGPIDDLHRVAIKSRAVMECPQCFRIWIQIEPCGQYKPYAPEEEPIKLAEQQGGYRG